MDLIRGPGVVRGGQGITFSFLSKADAWPHCSLLGLTKEGPIGSHERIQAAFGHLADDHEGAAAFTTLPPT